MSVVVRLILTLVVGMGASVGRDASAAKPVLSDVTIGIQGQFHVGSWTSFEADVASDAWPVLLTIVVPDPDGNLTRQPAYEIAKPTGDLARVQTTFMTGRLDDAIRVELEAGGETSIVLVDSEDSGEGSIVSAFKPPWTAATHLWAVAGEDEPFQIAADRIIKREAKKISSVYVIDLADINSLPTHPDALESLEILAVIGPQEISAETSKALRAWVADGGHLILSIADPDEFHNLAVSDWIPIEVTGQSRLRELSGIMTQVPGSVPIRISTVDAMQFEFEYGQTVASTLDGPLWAKLPYGFGHVSVIGVDISRRPFVDWTSLPLLCERLTNYQRVSDQSRRRTGTQLSQTGITELKTQLITGLDRYSQFDKPSSWLAMGYIVAFLLAIGPIDYLLVHKLLKRPHLTWVTFPLMVLLAVAFASRTAKERNPSERLANQIDLIDVDLASERVRTHSWMSFTSPTSDRYNIFVEPESPIGEFRSDEETTSRVWWAGIPETGFRGMYRSGGLNLAKTTYEFSSSKDALVGLPVAVWSSVNASGVVEGKISDPDRIVFANLTTEASQLYGTIANRLDIPLEDWIVAHEGRVYIPQTRVTGASALKIAPGETIDMGDARRIVPRVLQSYMTGVRRVLVNSPYAKGQDVRSTRDAYDPTANDPYETLKLASFFAAAKGYDFTSLTNHSLDRLDLSPLLPLGRAVLYCRVAEPAVRFERDGEPLDSSSHETILRIILPVDKK